MKAIIHAGSHKTATTSFQRLSYSSRNILLEAGVCYPVLHNRPCHNALVSELLGYSSGYIDSFAEQVKTAAECGLNILISAEDLESSLNGYVNCKPIIDIIHKAGYDVEWVFTVREPVEYLYSVYAEMSKHSGVVLDLYEIAVTVSKYKHLIVASPNYLWDFVFNAKELVLAFEERMKIKVKIVGFSDFLKGYPGRLVHRECLPDSTMETACQKISEKHRMGNLESGLNMRLSDIDIEWLYACKALGIRRQNFLSEHDDLVGLCRNIGIARIRRNRFFKKKIDMLMSW